MWKGKREVWKRGGRGEGGKGDESTEEKPKRKNIDRREQTDEVEGGRRPRQARVPSERLVHEVEE